MRYRKLDSAGDMLFGQQQADFWRDSPEAVAQAVLTRLRLWAGEWFLDVTDGTPYVQAALGTSKRQTIEPAIRSRILGTEGCTGIDSLSLSFDADTRVVTIAATIRTAYGQARISGAVNGNL